MGTLYSGFYTKIKIIVTIFYINNCYKISHMFYEYKIHLRMVQLRIKEYGIWVKYRTCNLKVYYWK